MMNASICASAQSVARSGGRAQRGASLIDAIVSIALMIIVFTGIVAAFRFSIETVTNNKSRAGAIALANERMEHLKSLSYGQIGVIGGIPAGSVPQQETVRENDVSYLRRTMVFYSDDPGDGLGSADTNGIIADFKTIRVEVGWNSRQGERSVSLIGRVSPPGVETAVPGGTLRIRAVNSSGTPVSDAEVNIANTNVSPAINIRTYTNEEGTITFIGAPAASRYAVSVTKPGYSRAETYAETGTNRNPTPRHLTVSSNRTTDEVFAIDYVSTKTVETYRRSVTAEWTDPFDDESRIASASGVTIDAGVASLAGPKPYPSSGVLRSSPVAPADLVEWNALSWTASAPSGTSVRYRVHDASQGGMLIPESVLPGNAAGFTVSPVQLSGVTSTAIAIEATLSTSVSSSTPGIETWSVSYERGPVPLPHLSFAIRGAKAIGNNPVIYKYDEVHESGDDSRVVLEDMEWDSYRISVPSSSGFSLAEACQPQPESLAPGTTQTTRLLVVPYSQHSLRVDIRSQGGALIPGASVRATSTSFSVTKRTSGCGQAYFGNLSARTYNLFISAPGYRPSYVSAPVNGTTERSFSLTPQ